MERYKLYLTGLLCFVSMCPGTNCLSSLVMANASVEVNSITQNAGETPSHDGEAAAQSNEEIAKSVRDFINKFYVDILPLVNKCQNYDKLIKCYFSAEFANTYLTVDEDVPDGDMGFFDYDLISNSQDPDYVKAAIKSVDIKDNGNGKIVANVKVSLMSKHYEPVPIALELGKTTKGWEILDYNNVLDGMKEFKKEMKKLK